MDERAHDSWGELLALRFPIADVTLRECEYPTCTAHGKKIAEIEFVRKFDGSWKRLQEWLAPWIVHLAPDELTGARIESTCSVGAPR